MLDNLRRLYTPPNNCFKLCEQLNLELLFKLECKGSRRVHARKKNHLPPALAVNKSRAVYILARARSTDFEEKIEGL